MSALRPTRRVRRPILPPTVRAALAPVAPARAPLGAPVGALIAALAAASPAAAQMSAAQVKAEIAFAHGLAQEWAFVDLAQQVLARVEQEGVSGKVREELDLVTCQVFATGARHERDPGRRNELFERAIREYTDFIDDNPYSQLKASAEAALVDTAATYARAIDHALEEAVGEEAGTLTARKVEILTETVKLTQDLIGALTAIPADDRTEKDLRELQGLMLNRGMMMAEIGRSSEDGTYFYERAIDCLEEIVFTFHEGTPPALRAYRRIGDVYRYKGDVESASWMYEGVVKQAWPMDPEEMRLLLETEGPFDRDQVAFRFLFLELAMEGLLDTFMARGEVAESCAYALHYYNTQRKEGLNYSAQGYQSLLAVARTLLEAGGYVGGDQARGDTRWFATEDEMKSEIRQRRQHDDAVSFALKLANTVNEENKGNILQLRAQKLISEISNRPGVVVSAEILVQAAEGEYNDGNYDAAIEGLWRVMRSLEAREPAERLEYGARVMNFLANSYRRDGRDLEAAMAFREGITTWQGDRVFDAWNAQGYYAMIKRVSQRNSGDQVLEAMLNEAENLVGRFGQERKQDEIFWIQGKRAYDAKEYDTAIPQFQKIGEGTNYYEKALVQIAVSKFRLGRADEALRTFEDYIEVYVVDPSKALESPIRIAKRTEAMAAAEFFRGLILFMKAQKSGDPSLFERVAEILADYADRYKTQDVLAPWTVQLVMQSHLALGNRSEARGAIDHMIRDWPDHRRTGSSSVRFYNAVKTLRAATTDPDQKKVLLREMAEFLKLGNQLGKVEFNPLRNESRHWMELREYEEAERVLSKLSERFGGDPEQAEHMAKLVLPDLGHALLALGRVQDAKAILNPLVMDDTARPSKRTVLNWARSISGWLTGSGNQVQEVPGAGGTPQEWQKVIDKLDTITKVGERWSSCEWYEQKLMMVYAYHAWSKDDDSKRESAKRQLRGFDSQLRDDTYAGVGQYCDEDEDPDQVERLGGKVLQSRFLWMARALR